MRPESKRKLRSIGILFEALMMLVLFATGTFVLFTFTLFTEFANLWMRAGLASLFYGFALRHLTFNEQMRKWVRLSSISVLRVAWIANIVAGCLCGIGSILVGGAIGWLGVALSVFWVTTWAWILRQSASLIDSLDESH